MGVELDCPTHRAHRLRLWFANPGDGKAPPLPEELPGERLYWRIGGDEEDGFDGLSIVEPIDLPGHWRGWALDGRVFLSLVRGVAW